MLYTNSLKQIKVLSEADHCNAATCCRLRGKPVNDSIIKLLLLLQRHINPPSKGYCCTSCNISHTMWFHKCVGCFEMIRAASPVFVDVCECVVWSEYMCESKFGLMTLVKLMFPWAVLIGPTAELWYLIMSSSCHTHTHKRADQTTESHIEL